MKFPELRVGQMVRVAWLDTGLAMEADQSDVPHDGCSLVVQRTRGELVYVGKDYIVILYEDHADNPTGHRIRASIHTDSIQQIDIWQPESATHWERNVKRSRIKTRRTTPTSQQTGQGV